MAGRNYSNQFKSSLRNTGSVEGQMKNVVVRGLATHAAQRGSTAAIRKNGATARSAIDDAQAAKKGTLGPNPHSKYKRGTKS